MPIASVPDHVAVAVPHLGTAAARWRGLGGEWASPLLRDEQAGFGTRQLRYRGGAKLELLEPVGDDSFAAAFVARFGARIHHVTLTVPELLPAVGTLRDEGYDVVDVFAEGDVWHEGFLRPSQVGGMIVQVAWSGRTDEQWASTMDEPLREPSPTAARLIGPTLTHPDRDAARRLWCSLGAEVAEDGDALVVGWPGAALDVRVEPGPTAGPVGLRFEGASSLADDPVLGPATLPA